jgi:formamidopyrimidine-DNA glycosylase
MLELPESATLARQLNESVHGLRIEEALAAGTPHKFAFFTGNPEDYAQRLIGREILGAASFGGILEIDLNGLLLLFSDGANLRLLKRGSAPPEKHQLLLRLSDGSALVCTVQMYAGIHLCIAGQFHSVYHQAAHEKPSPLGDAFSQAYFLDLATANSKLSAKAFLATEQRIPGLGNGTLQDILLRAGLHPKAKVSTLSHQTLGELHKQIRDTLQEMTALGGRDTEKDLHGLPGGYTTLMSKATLGRPCPTCCSPILRESYLGGNVYYCPHCQTM